MPKQAKLTHIKGLRCYTVKEAADVTGVSMRTVREWVKNGLRLLDRERPAFIRGDDLSAFLKSQRVAKKIKLLENEFYCVSCRKARCAAGGLVECNTIANRAVLTALCETCETVLSKPIAIACIPQLQVIFDLTIQRRE